MTSGSAGDHVSGWPAAETDAPNLADLMNQVLDKIGDAERRNGELLREMQERLASLGQDVRAVRPKVPEEYRPGFERIEDGMSLLANRIAETYFARASAAVPAAASAHAFSSARDAHLEAASAAPVTLPQSAIANVEAGFALAAPQTFSQPNPLRSSSPGQMRARAGAYGADVDTFDVVESLPGNPAEPWSPDQAAALSRLYSTREALFGDSAELVQDTASAYVPSAANTALPLVGLPRAGNTDALERRLNDIAVRIETSLAARPQAGLESLDQRLDLFEQRMSVTLKGVASRADVEGLRLAENHLEDLRAQFEHTNRELERLDGLEQQLHAIAQQVTEERLNAVIARAIPAAAAAPSRTDADFHGVAIAAAEAAAARVALGQRDNRSGDVHSLLTDFIQERRQGDEQTAHTLDTLQQAMLRMLDRVETMEGAATFAGEHYDARDEHPAPAPAQYAPAAPAAPAYDEPAEAAAPVSAKDYLAEQRAKMQASVQRAAMAQREKAQNGPETAAAGKAAMRTVKPQAAGGAKRLMVSGLALAVVAAGSAGALLMTMPRSEPAANPIVAAQPAPAPVLAGQASRPAQAGAATGEAKLRAAAEGGSEVLNGMQATPPQLARKDGLPDIVNPRLMPETVTDDIGQSDSVREVDRVPDSNNVRSNFAKSQYTQQAPVTGILLQKTATGDYQQAELPVLANATAGDITAPAVAASARPDDLTGQPPAEGGAAGAVRGTLDLPPATVGPLSLRLAAAQGDASAEFEVASRLAEGKGTDQNLKEAVRWYQRSATQGFAQAQYRLGTFYERGLGLKPDLGRARTWYQRAADQGNVKAMHNLAVLAAGRSSESPDYATAAHWFTQAASYGLADSQFNLAVLCESGLGVEKDLVQAAMWFTVAAKSGDKEAVRRRDLMKSKLDTAGLAAADHLAKNWQPMVSEKLANDPRFAGEVWKSRQAATPDNG